MIDRLRHVFPVAAVSRAGCGAVLFALDLACATSTPQRVLVLSVSNELGREIAEVSAPTTRPGRSSPMSCAAC